MNGWPRTTAPNSHGWGFDMESRKETTDLKRQEPIDRRYKGDAQIPAYRRWLQRRLVEAADNGDQKEVERVRSEMRKAGITDG